MQLAPEKIEELLDGIRERIFIANRNDTLLDILNRVGWGDLLPIDPIDGFETHPAGQIVVLGASEVKKEKLLGVAKALGISKDRLELCLDYEDLVRYDYRKLQYKAKYRLVLVGPMPHSTAGTGDFSSTISAIQNEPGYPKVVELRAGGELKITKSNFTETLRGLLDEGYLLAG